MSVDPIRVLIADDHEVVRLGLKQTLQSNPRIQVVGEAGSGRETLALIGELKPDVILLDITMPNLDGFDVIADLRKQRAQVKIILVTMHLDDEMMERALAAGVDGYMMKNLPKEQLTEAVLQVMTGRKAIHETVFQTIGQKYATSITKDASGLTRREREILRYIVDGLTSAQIADRLFISPRTVDTHRANMMQKLGLNNVAALVRYALDNKTLAK